MQREIKTPPAGAAREVGSGGERGAEGPAGSGAQSRQADPPAFRRNEHPSRGIQRGDGKVEADQHALLHASNQRPEGSSRGQEGTPSASRAARKIQDPATILKLIRIASAARVRWPSGHQGGQHRAGGQAGWPGHRPWGSATAAPTPSGRGRLCEHQASCPPPTTPDAALMASSRPGSTCVLAIKQLRIRSILLPRASSGEAPITSCQEAAPGLNTKSRSGISPDQWCRHTDLQSSLKAGARPNRNQVRVEFRPGPPLGHQEPLFEHLWRQW